jgi:hypothetical protein
MATKQFTRKEIERAERKFNSVQIRLINAVTKIETILDEIPQKGDTAQFCQKMNLIDKLKSFEYAINGLCIEDFITEE